MEGHLLDEQCHRSTLMVKKMYTIICVFFLQVSSYLKLLIKAYAISIFLWRDPDLFLVTSYDIKNFCICSCCFEDNWCEIDLRKANKGALKACSKILLRVIWNGGVVQISFFFVSSQTFGFFANASFYPKTLDMWSCAYKSKSIRTIYFSVCGQFF